jgi:hypothetical protein
MKLKKLIFAVLSLTCWIQSYAQDELLNLVNEGKSEKVKEFEIATFKTTRLVNFHTIETQSKHTLDFRISHRFGDMTLNNPSANAYNAFGLDAQASIKLSLEYCFDGRFQIGIGRGNDQKLLDGFAKYRLLRQTTDNRNPVSITLFTGAYHTFNRTGDDIYARALDRLSFCNQIMVARKFNRRFSFQVGGAYVHYNIVPTATDKNDMYFATFVTRYKLSNRVALTAEYAASLNKYSDTNYYNSASIGVDIETGGHVFQISFSNSFGLDESEYFTHTNKDWNQSQFRLGFNISRVFDL